MYCIYNLLLFYPPWMYFIPDIKICLLSDIFITQELLFLVVLHLSLYFLFHLKRLFHHYIYSAPHTMLDPIVNLILPIFLSYHYFITLYCMRRAQGYLYLSRTHLKYDCTSKMWEARRTHSDWLYEINKVPMYILCM